MKTKLPSIFPADYSHSFNPFIYNAVPSGMSVLDVGCWNGNLGKILINKKNCIVDGIDNNKVILGQAKKNGYKTNYPINLNTEPKKLKKITNRYDVIICADILEHLTDPEYVLKLLKSLLKSDGVIIISVPNVAFGLNRWNLLKGEWDYTEFGTLDKTHLRFFTARTLKELVMKTGLIIECFKPYNQFGILSKISPLDQIWPTFLCFQLLLIAKNEK